MACPICANLMMPCFKATVLGKYAAQYEVCAGCGYLCAHEPHWLDEAYSRAIVTADTGLVARNIAIANKLTGILYWILNERGAGRFMDAAGGYGMLTRLMRDIGFDFYWTDKYCENLLVPGFEYKESLGPCRAITAMEVLEHLTDPGAFVEEKMALSGAEALIFTTELYQGEPPHPDAWWYYTFATGQHIGFFQRRTLEMLGAKMGLHFASANGIHLFSKNEVNERLLGVVTGRWASRFGLWWIRRHLISKTMSDHHLMVQGIA